MFLCAMVLGDRIAPESGFGDGFGVRIRVRIRGYNSSIRSIYLGSISLGSDSLPNVVYALGCLHHVRQNSHMSFVGLCLVEDDTISSTAFCPVCSSVHSSHLSARPPRTPQSRPRILWDPPSQTPQDYPGEVPGRCLGALGGCLGGPAPPPDPFLQSKAPTHVCDDPSKWMARSTHIECFDVSCSLGLRYKTVM